MEKHYQFVNLKKGKRGGDLVFAGWYYLHSEATFTVDKQEIGTVIIFIP